ncbi:MAG TPA: Mov34/MPN/PAD-1 family protein [Solirubrobacteraceae bacterium]
MSRRTRMAIYDHVFAADDREVGGVLVGHRQPGEPALIRSSVPALEAEGDLTRLTFTHEAWARVHEIMEAEHPHEEIVGWYHSHPGHGIFLSDHDEFIHRNFFADESSIAYVVDPQQGLEGIFGWHDGELVLFQQGETLYTGTREARARADERQRGVGRRHRRVPRAAPPPPPQQPQPQPQPQRSVPAPARGDRGYPLLGYLLPGALGLMLGLLVALALAGGGGGSSDTERPQSPSSSGTSQQSEAQRAAELERQLQAEEDARRRKQQQGQGGQFDEGAVPPSDDSDASQCAQIGACDGQVVP